MYSTYNICSDCACVSLGLHSMSGNSLKREAQSRALSILIGFACASAFPDTHKTIRSAPHGLVNYTQCVMRASEAVSLPRKMVYAYCIYSTVLCI